MKMADSTPINYFFTISPNYTISVLSIFNYPNFGDT